MANLFLLVFDENSSPRQTVLDFLKARPEIADFHATIPSNLVVIVSDLDLASLRDLLNKDGGFHYFLLVSAGRGRGGQVLDGYLPKATWEYIQSNPKPTPVAAPASVQEAVS